MKYVEQAENTDKKDGLLLAGDEDGYAPVTSAADAEKSLAIAYANEDSAATVTQAYFSGRFHENKILIGDLDIEDFREGMRKCNLILTKEMEVE